MTTVSETSTAVAKREEKRERRTLTQWFRSFFFREASGPWTDVKRTKTVVKSVKRDGRNAIIFTLDGYEFTIPVADLAVSTGDVLTIWGGPPEHVRGLAVGSVVLWWCSEEDYLRLEGEEKSAALQRLRDNFGTREAQEAMRVLANEHVHPALLPRLNRLWDSTDDFAWRHLMRELFVSIDATNLSRVFLLRGDYYTLRSSPSWRALKQAVEWAFLDKKITDPVINGTPGLSPYHTLATLDMTLTLAERLAKNELEGITDVPAIVDTEPPRLLENHREMAPFPVYLTAAAPPMRLD